MNEDTHFLLHYKFKMACGKRPDQVYGSASYWQYVTCQNCLAHKDEFSDDYPGDKR